MIRLSPTFLLLLTVLLGVVSDSRARQLHNGQAVNLWKLNKAHAARQSELLYASDRSQHPLVTQLSYKAQLRSKFPAHTFTQPLDHFTNATTDTFKQRYWINTRHYKPNSNAPVIVIDGGETSGEDRLPFLDYGIADILAEATGGVGVVLEHRYYGESIGVHNLSTDALRFLNNDQAAEDSANFMRNVKFPGIDEDLTSPNAPWIYYGGSYAGARAAHMRVLYPDITFGAIASSAVTHAAVEFWEYFDAIRLHADSVCISHLESAVSNIDRLLTLPLVKNRVKKMFGLPGLTDEDFASVLQTPLGSWQARNWDPAVGSSHWETFCETLDRPIFSRSGLVSALDQTAWYDHGSRKVTFKAEAANEEDFVVDLSVINYAKYIKENVVSKCPTEDGMSIEQCFGTNDDEQYQGISLDEEWRLWLFQVCTEWGYFMTAPPAPTPRIVSNFLTLPYESKICAQAFPPGDFFSIPSVPDVSKVNRLGSFDIGLGPNGEETGKDAEKGKRLAIIDGDADPWKPATPHSRYARERTDTIEKPFKLIPEGVHHYDENGLEDHSKEPAEIRKIHKEIIEFVKAWLEDWEPPKKA